MSIRTLRNLLFCSLFLASFVRLSPAHSDEPARVEILVGRVERVSRDEVHFWLKVSNRSDRPMFLAGTSFESRKPTPELIFIQQWQPEEGWKESYCTDTPPPHVIKLNPREAITQEMWVKLPMSVVCRNPIMRLEGRFRFRLEYFESEKQARAYVKKLFSDRWREARAPVAVSEPFEIPPAPNPEH